MAEEKPGMFQDYNSLLLFLARGCCAFLVFGVLLSGVFLLVINTGGGNMLCGLSLIGVSIVIGKQFEHINGVAGVAISVFCFILWGFGLWYLLLGASSAMGGFS